MLEKVYGRILDWKVRYRGNGHRRDMAGECERLPAGYVGVFLYCSLHTDYVFLASALMCTTDVSLRFWSPCCSCALNLSYRLS